jgi:hypothetical protein
LQNTGVLDLPEVAAQLISLDTSITATDPTGTYGTIDIDANVANSSDPFVVTASAQAYRGSPANLMLVVTSSVGYLDTIRFTVNIGQATTHDPTGPDPFGYFAFDNTDSTYAPRPAFDYVPINQIGNNLNLNDPGEENDTASYSVARRLPFPFKFYDQIYDSITICSNGWCAFGNQAWNGAHLNMPIPGLLSPDALIAPYWDDLRTTGTGRGVWDYFDSENGHYIIQWKATGAYTTTANLDFEVVLLDTAMFPSLDGNGKILVQYQSVTMDLPGGPYEPEGCSIGIQAPHGLVGTQWVYGADYSPGAASVQNGRAILFSTVGRTRPLSTPSPRVIPSNLALYQNFPNPFNPLTEIQFDLPATTHVTLEVFDILGRKVTSLLDAAQEAGSHYVVWDSRDQNGLPVSSGMYIYRLKASGTSVANKMLLIR